MLVDQSKFKRNLRFWYTLTRFTIKREFFSNLVPPLLISGPICETVGKMLIAAKFILAVALLLHQVDGTDSLEQYPKPNPRAGTFVDLNNAVEIVRSPKNAVLYPEAVKPPKRRRVRARNQAPKLRFMSTGNSKRVESPRKNVELGRLVESFVSQMPSQSQSPKKPTPPKRSFVYVKKQEPRHDDDMQEHHQVSNIPESPESDDHSRVTSPQSVSESVQVLLDGDAHQKTTPTEAHSPPAVESLSFAAVGLQSEGLLTLPLSSQPEHVSQAPLSPLSFASGLPESHVGEESSPALIPNQSNPSHESVDAQSVSVFILNVSGSAATTESVTSHVSSSFATTTTTSFNIATGENTGADHEAAVNVQHIDPPVIPSPETESNHEPQTQDSPVIPVPITEVIAKVDQEPQPQPQDSSVIHVPAVEVNGANQEAETQHLDSPDTPHLVIRIDPPQQAAIEMNSAVGEETLSPEAVTTTSSNRVNVVNVHRDYEVIAVPIDSPFSPNSVTKDSVDVNHEAQAQYPDLPNITDHVTSTNLPVQESSVETLSAAYTAVHDSPQPTTKKVMNHGVPRGRKHSPSQKKGVGTLVYRKKLVQPSTESTGKNEESQQSSH